MALNVKVRETYGDSIDYREGLISDLYSSCQDTELGKIGVLTRDIEWMVDGMLLARAKSRRCPSMWVDKNFSVEYIGTNCTRYLFEIRSLNNDDITGKMLDDIAFELRKRYMEAGFVDSETIVLHDKKKISLSLLVKNFTD